MRPRMASSIWEPMIVTPVRNAAPAHAPTTATATSATARCGASATTTSARPANTMPTPNSRSCGSRRASFGAPASPSAAPTKTATNNRPNEESPPPRLDEYAFAEPITAPPAANAPAIPISSPRTSGVVRT